MEIAKEFRWEMGHRLPYHEGGCRNVHGHSYRMRVVAVGTVDERGMVVDYFDIRAAVAPIVEEMDHAFLVDRSDEEMLEFLRRNQMKRVEVDFPSTAENIADWLLGKVAEALSRYPNLDRLSVRVHETENTYALASRDLTRAGQQ